MEFGLKEQEIPQQRQAGNRKAQAGFDNSSQFFILKFLFNKFIVAFSFWHLLFKQAGFVIAFFVSPWFRLDKVAFFFFKIAFKFYCSYFFSVFSSFSFCCCGVGQLLKPLLFLSAAAHNFFASRFSFYTAMQSAFVFCCCLLVDGWQFTFSVSTFKITPGFAVNTFFVAVLVWQSEFICKQIFFGWTQ